MPARINIPSGQRFGRLRYVKDSESTNRIRYGLFICDCGLQTSVAIQDVRSGHTRSCGCLHTEIRRAPITHGETLGRTQSDEYVAWKAMKARCLYPKSISFHNYGGRGITVHPEWIRSFDAFLTEVGRKPSKAHSLDRIDNGKGYEPGNVRWATRVEQRRNARTVTPVTYKGETKLIVEWSELSGVPEESISSRLRKGWDVERAIFEPIRRARKARAA